MTSLPLGVVDVARVYGMPGSIGVPDNRSAAILAEAGRGDNGLIVMISVWMSIYAAPDERKKRKNAPGTTRGVRWRDEGSIPSIRGQWTRCVTKAIGAARQAAHEHHESRK